MTELQKDFIYLCNLFGACSHRCQGAGGNISVKENNSLYIKASGYSLSSVTTESGFVVCDISAIKHCLANDIEILESTYNSTTLYKPSMEAFFHILPKKYIVHIHPTFFCKFLCRKEANTLFSQENFPGSLFIKYTKPGIELAKSIMKSYRDECCIFLENHGIILLSSTIDSIIELYTSVEAKLEEIVQEKKNISPICIEHQLYSLTNLVAKPVYRIQTPLPDTFLAITPDHVLFLRRSVLKIPDRKAISLHISNWLEEKKELPSIVEIENVVYCLGKNYNQCQSKEEYLYSYFNIVESRLLPSYEELSEYDIQQLFQCKKEKYRLNTL